MSKIKLKPCPFCGGKAVVGWQVMHGDKIWHVECQSVECSTSECYRKTRREAIAAWNTRPIEAALEKQVDDLQGELAQSGEVSRVMGALSLGGDA